MFLYLDFRCYFEANGPNYTDSFSVKGTLEFRYVGAHPGVSIQMSISLGKTFLRISRIQNFPLTWILARVFVYVPLSFPDSGLYLLNGFDFYFDLFWMAWHWKPAIKICFSSQNKSKQILACEIEKNDLRKGLYLLKNKAYNLLNFSTFAAILKVLHPQCIAIVVRTPPGSVSS